MEKKLLTIIVLVTIASLSIAGCTTSSNQAASNASQAASTTANTTTSASGASAGGANNANNANNGANNANGAQKTSTTIPTAIVFLAQPTSPVVQGNDVMVTFEVTSNGSCTSGLPASVSLDGISIGQLTSAQGPSGCEPISFNWGALSLTTGQPHIISVSFAGNAQYGPSSGQVTFTETAGAGGTFVPITGNAT